MKKSVSREDKSKLARVREDKICENLLMADMTCPDCGGDMDQIEKTTFTGRDMREYQCRKCGKTTIEDRGPALWQILSDAREKEGKE